MNQRKIVTASLAIVLVLSSLTSCGSKPTQPAPPETTTTAFSATENNSVADTATEAISEDTTAESSSEPVTEEPVDSETSSESENAEGDVAQQDSDEKEIREVVTKFNSLSTEKPEEIMDIVDLQVLYYVETGKKAENDQEIIDIFNKENDTEIVAEINSFSNDGYEIIAVKDLSECDDLTVGLVTARTEQEISDIISDAFGMEHSEVVEDEGFDMIPFPLVKDELSIEDIKVVTMKMTDTEGDNDYEFNYYVVKRDGKWRVEVLYSLENMMVQMFSSLSSEITVDINAEETPSEDTNVDTVEEKPDNNSETVE